MTYYNEDRNIWILDDIFLTIFPHLTNKLNERTFKPAIGPKFYDAEKQKQFSSFNMGLVSSIFTITSFLADGAKLIGTFYYYQ